MFILDVLAIGSAVYFGKKAYTKVQESERFRSILGERKRERLEVLDVDENKAHSSETKERQLVEQNQNLTISSVSLGLATMGVFFYRPLLMVSPFPAIYTMLPLFKSTYQSVVKERRLQISALDSIVLVGYLTTGSFVALSLGTWAYHLARRTWLNAEKEADTNYLTQYGADDHSAWIHLDHLNIEMDKGHISQGDVVVVNAGERIPVDGIITEGFATVDEAHLSGREQQADKAVGDRVHASTQVLYGQVFVKTEQVGEETVASQIRGVYNAAKVKSEIQVASEEATNNTARWRLALGALAWPLLGPAVALAVPTSYFGQNLGDLTRLNELNFTRIASENGILFRDRAHLMSLNRVNTVVFDLNGALLRQQEPEAKPAVRAEAQEVIDFLTKRFKKVYIVSERSELQTQRWAKALGVENYAARQTTQTKADLIKQLKHDGQVVAFVGDGLHDKWAMKQADVSIALCDLYDETYGTDSGSDSKFDSKFGRGTSAISINPADVLLIKNTLEQLPLLFRISQRFAIKLLTNRVITTVPGVLYMGGALLFHMGVPVSMFLNYSGLALSTRNSVLPLLRQRKEKEQIEQEIQASLPVK